MRYDYTKSKSYQKIVSKAKKYSSQGSTSLKAQRKRMQERRADFGYLKDQGVIETTKAGTKVLKEVKESGYSGAKKVLSTYTPEQRDAIGVIVKRRGTLLQKIGFDSIQKENHLNILQRKKQLSQKQEHY